MRNIIGTPVEGEDFFDRPQIVANLLSELRDNQANILLIAPRRVGKTSLIKRVCEEWRKEQQSKAIYLNIEGGSDELAFADNLIDKLMRSNLYPEIMTLANSIIKNAQKLIGLKSIKYEGLEVDLGEASKDDLRTLGKVLESVFRKIDEGNDHVLIALDEVPELLLTLMRSDEIAGPKRVVAFLHWLRAMRQTYRHKIRWVFLGSIGLDNFASNHNIHYLINDFQIFSLDAFTPEEADEFLQKLGESYKGEITIDSADRTEIIRRVGWPLAYHLHLIFKELLYSKTLSVNEAFDSLLKPQYQLYFKPWSERIVAQFSKPDAEACNTILSHACQDPDGCDRRQFLAVLTTKPTADVKIIEEQILRLLNDLERDGYLIQKDSRYAFRSFLLREYWKRNHIL
jgi:AAA+ ATPase superfamily predicted ATPase